MNNLKNFVRSFVHPLDVADNLLWFATDETMLTGRVSNSVNHAAKFVFWGRPQMQNIIAAARKRINSIAKLVDHNDVYHLVVELTELRDQTAFDIDEAILVLSWMGNYRPEIFTMNRGKLIKICDRQTQDAWAWFQDSVNFIRNTVSDEGQIPLSIYRGYYNAIRCKH